MDDTGEPALYLQWIGIGADTIEAIAVVIIVGYIFIATIGWLLRSLREHRFTLEHYGSFRAALARALLLGLEILIAADVVRTAALSPSLKNFEALGVLVVVRTFLSWSIIVEIEGRWPWQARRDSSAASAESSV